MKGTLPKAHGSVEIAAERLRDDPVFGGEDLENLIAVFRAARLHLNHDVDLIDPETYIEAIMSNLEHIGPQVLHLRQEAG
jgi:hypothetical protein